MVSSVSKSPVRKRSVVLDGRKTSISVEDQFWDAFKEIADARVTTVAKLASQIDRGKQANNLSSAVRLFVLNYFVEMSRNS